jgi:predicted metal-dependent hydrolase
MRIVVDPLRGVVVTIPPAGRRGWSRAEDRVMDFLAERESWVRRHVVRQDRLRREMVARGGFRDGALVRYRGELHRLRIESALSAPASPPALSARASLPALRAPTFLPAPPRSSVTREGDVAGDVLVLRLGALDRREPRRVVIDWCRERAHEAIDRAVAAHASALGVSPAGITLRDPRTRWGSASRQQRLSFSWRLILAPPEALETVVVHELAHLRVFGHDPRFWALVASRRPDHATWRRWLRMHAFELHTAFDSDG